MRARIAASIMDAYKARGESFDPDFVWQIADHVIGGLVGALVEHDATVKHDSTIVSPGLLKLTNNEAPELSASLILG